MKDWVFYYFICEDAGLIENIDYDSAMNKIIKFFLQDTEMLLKRGEEKLIKYFLENPHMLNEGLHPAFLPVCFYNLECE